MENPDRRFVAILGGAKIADKLGVINNLLEKVDTLIVSGGMTYTFTVAKGGKIGNSMLEEDKIEYAREMIEKAKDKGVKLLLPVDTVVADRFANDANIKVVPTNDIPDGWQGLDIGPKTCALFAEAIKGAKTVIWNGPMGVFEMPNFAEGTRAVAQAMADSGATTIVGGGDTDVAVHKTGESDKITFISTGGGASLELLEGKILPAIQALENCGAGA